MLAVLDQHRQVVHAKYHVLRRADDRLAVGRLEQVLGGKHQRACFLDRLGRERDVDRHLVAVEVGVERGAHQRMQVDRLALHQHGLECLDAQAVERRGAVEEHRAVLDHFFQDLPHLRTLPFDDALGALDVGGVVVGDQLGDHEGPVELERHRLGQAALEQLQVRADDDYRAARVVDALAEQVAAEAPLLALEHVAERLELAPAPSGESLATLGVVDQRVDRLLQHALLVAHDDVRRAELDQPLEPVVAVDHPPVQVVQVGGGEAPAVELNHRAQVGRDHRQDGHHHPLRTVARAPESLDDLQSLGRLLLALLAARGAGLLPTAPWRASPDRCAAGFRRRPRRPCRPGRPGPTSP